MANDRADATFEETSTTVPPKILVADDDRVYQTLLERSARAWGYEPVVVGDGEQAWREINRRDGPRIALLDWVMPGVDGLEVCRRVRQASLPHYVYLILLTANTGSHDLISGLEAGADEFVGKPVKLEQLRLQVRTGMRIVQSGSSRPSPSQPELLLDQLRRLSARLFRTQEEERSRVARALHEGVAQDLGSVLLQLGIAASAEPEPRGEILRRVSATTEDAIRRVRSLAYTLYPLLLDEIGLVAALQQYADDVCQDAEGPVELILPGDFGRVDLHVERALFRIAQEAIEDARQRAGSSRAVIQLRREKGEARLEIRDDRDGSAAAEPEQDGIVQAGEGVAVLAMRERAEHASGRLELHSGPSGTTVVAILPISPERDTNR